MKKNSLFNLTYIGGPTVIIEIDGTRFMTDPTLDARGSVFDLGGATFKKITDPANTDTGKIDIVLLSHDQHHDNLDNLGRELLKTVSKTYTTVEASQRLDTPAIGLSPWEQETIITKNGIEITITATPARHGPAGTEKVAGDVIGFLLSVKGTEPFELYFTGDTVYYEGIQEVANKHQPDYVFIYAGAAKPIGPFNVTMDTNDAIDTAFVFPHSEIIPLHFEGWNHYTESEKDIMNAFQAIGIGHKLNVLPLGEKKDFYK